jgi:cytochrome c556
MHRSNALPQLRISQAVHALIWPETCQSFGNRCLVEDTVMVRSTRDSEVAGTWARFAIAAGVLALLGVAGITCTTQSKDAGPAQGHDVKPVARHALHSAQLEAVMEDIERYRRQSWPQEVEAELDSAKLARSQRAFARASQLSERLATAAGQVARALEDVELSESDRRAFLAKVEVFKDQVDRLRQAVTEQDAADMRRAMREIDTTCTSCHERFRDVSGPLGS